VDDHRFDRAIAAIDAVNAGDPNQLTVKGVTRAKELAHAELVSEWVRRLRPDADELLLLAARGHHLRRWQSPRSSYPEGRAGYLRWRRDLSERQAEELGQLLGKEGYEAGDVERVRAIVRKRGLGTDADVQALEDALCLTFLETQLGDLVAKTDEPKMVDILRKTMAKMSPAAIALASSLELDSEGHRLLTEAATPTETPSRPARRGRG
jgi:hypothetical protein